MKPKWIITGLAAGLLALAVAGGAVLANGGGTGSGGPGPVAARSAEILGVGAQAMADAMAQVDGQIEADYVDGVLAQAVADGDITEEQAETIRTQVESGDWSGFDQLLSDSSNETCDWDIAHVELYEASNPEYYERVGSKLGLESDAVADAFSQAYDALPSDSAHSAWDIDDDSHPVVVSASETLGVSAQALFTAMDQVDAAMVSEYVDEVLTEAVADGTITEEEADDIRAQVEDGDYSEFDQLLLDLAGLGGDCVLFDVSASQEPFLQEYSSGVGEILDVEGDSVADAILQAFDELLPQDPTVADDGLAWYGYIPVSELVAFGSNSG